MGSRRSTGIRLDVAPRVQRRGGHPVHVRPDSQVDIEQYQRVVQASQGVQQGLSRARCEHEDPGITPDIAH